MAFTNQPQAVEMGVQSQSLPVSMQYLTGLDTIICKQKIEMAEVLTGFETRNKYGLYNKEGQQIFFVEEQSDAMERCYNPGGRGFNLQVTDNHRLEVMRFTRDFKWCLNCCCCAGGACQMVINVEHPPGKIIGRVKGADATCNHHVQLFDAVDNHKFTIWTTCCPCQDVCCPDDINIPVILVVHNITIIYIQCIIL
ncbi:hypothetical protein ACF0H5_023575 [Mactra antiquata]